MNNLPFHTMPDHPQDVSATQVLARLVEGLGFRYYWATEGLSEQDFAFRPVESSMSIEELMSHIYDLAYGSNRRVGNSKEEQIAANSNDDYRRLTLETLKALSDALRSMPDSDLFIGIPDKPKPLPFWFWVNGPIADALTHIGQIVSWRRINGNPQPKGVNVFFGTKS